MSSHDERRRFQRIAFDATTHLRQDGLTWDVHLLDLSLHGLLVERPAQWDADTTRALEAVIELSDKAQVVMQVELRHEESNHLGFACETIDVDSMTHLHRLVELNLADQEAMRREWQALIEEHRAL
ncbi:PilZ domain-containing protein [Pseudomonas alabamensis]|uniref:PilZ domain-containing protein n=1 Tax=Pseudomonas alabamensis TaxID=3064349 RepID=UPI0021D9A744|nr:PilZ domain-containing protein [Pseudomonas entomophila]